MKMLWKLAVTSCLIGAASGSVPSFAVSPMSTGLSMGVVVVAVAPDEDAYAQGTRAMNERRWPDAVHAFDEVIAAKTARRMEAALYWKAYSLSKMSRHADAAASCEVLRAKYPASSWNNDCGALSINVQVDLKNMQMPVVVVPSEGIEVGSSAKPGSDEDLKLLALNSLARQDPSRAIPMLRNILSNSPSAEMRQHAIFVLAQSKSPEARALLNDVAMGKMGVPLQAQTIRMMGVFEGKRANDTLADVYRTTKDAEVKRAVISAFFISQDAPRMVEMARNEKDLDMKRTIVSQLALMNDKAATDYMLELLK